MAPNRRPFLWHDPASLSKTQHSAKFGDPLRVSYLWSNSSPIKRLENSQIDIWHVLPEFNLDEDLIDSKQMLRRPPLEIEWTRFQQRYSPKVRRLVVSGWTRVDSFTLELFHICSHRNPLLTDLVELIWRDGGIDLSFMTFFVSKSLTSITINIFGSPRIALPLTMLPVMTPDISTIQFGYSFGYCLSESSMEEASSPLFEGCSRLRRYHVSAPLSSSAFSLAMQLPLLESLWIKDPIQLPAPLPDVVFPRLRSIEIVALDGDFSWLQLFPKCSLLTTIVVSCPGPLFEPFIETFQLTIARCDMPERLVHFSVQGYDFKITPKMIDCNLSLKNLTTFQLSSGCSRGICRTSEITDQDIDLLTNSMPALNTLAIGLEPCRVPSRITFNSLYTISSRCTQLKSLLIHFNPETFITTFEANELENPPTLLCSVTSIDVGSIRLPRYPDVSIIMAAGLLKVFPCLERVVYYAWQWSNVNTQIEVLNPVNKV